MEILEDALTIQEIFSMQNILIYLIIINVLSFLTMFLDKRKAKRNAWRIPEKALFILAMIGGSVGTIAGMYIFRHKTKKIKFTIGLPTILIIQGIIVIYTILK